MVRVLPVVQAPVLQNCPVPQPVPSETLLAATQEATPPVQAVSKIWQELAAAGVQAMPAVHVPASGLAEELPPHAARIETATAEARTLATMTPLC
jgi:hypothetical protein